MLGDAMREVYNRTGSQGAPVLDLAVRALSPSDRARELVEYIRLAARLSPPAPNRRALARTLLSRLAEIARAPRPGFIDAGTRDGALETLLLVYGKVPVLKTIERALL